MTIRIFVGCSANGEDAEMQALLEYSLRHYATEQLELNWMMLSRDPSSPWYSEPKKNAGWNTALWATPFSVFRWAIPHVCNFEGKAIYMDVDMIAKANIADLWNQEMPKAVLWKNEKQSCVMVMDCAKLKTVLRSSFEEMRRKEGGYSVYRDYVRPHATNFAGNWNCLDGENYKTLADPDIKILHFTTVPTQPHLKWALPRLKEAGMQHWNRQASGVPHARADVQPMVDHLWKRAQEAGYNAERYIPKQMFGSYNAVRGGARAA
jgi:hypothetical protein